MKNFIFKIKIASKGYAADSDQPLTRMDLVLNSNMRQKNVEIMSLKLLNVLIACADLYAGNILL